MQLSDYMASEGWNDVQAAAKLGCAPQTISRYRRGLITPSLKAMDRIAKWSKGAVTRDSWPLQSKAAA
jgi:transcriptional regulator with XRE-family HTH domain